MEGKSDRKARFVTVIALIRGEELKMFEGKVEGNITNEPTGSEGFGYDPIFLPDESAVTFACMTADAKNAISHRGRATAKLLSYLDSL